MRFWQAAILIAGWQLIGMVMVIMLPLFVAAIGVPAFGLLIGSYLGAQAERNDAILGRARREVDDV